jgi:ubiquinone biosynthesis protein
MLKAVDGLRHAQHATPRSTLKRRRDEVVECLAAHGLARGPHRVRRNARSGETRTGGLRAALEELGPVFSAFGLYLSARVDLLPARDCLELAALPDRALPMPPFAAHDLFGHETGRAPEDVFIAFEDEPFESRLLYQSHRARLPDGSPVVVKLVHPEAEQRFLHDVELLHLLEGALGGLPSGGAAFRGAVSDFAGALGRRLDFAHEAKALETLARDAEEFETWRVPEVSRGLCAQRVLTIEELTGFRLDGEETSAAGGRRALPSGVDRTNLARLLCSAWLRHALLGHVFPVQPRPADFVILPDKRLGFTGGLFDSLPAESQTNLWEYLIATAGENPDQACSCLLREVRREGAASGEEELRHHLRQVVPFRDSEWHQDDDTDQLVEHLVVQWRAAASCGYVPQPHLPSFYRGLFAVSDTARRLSPAGDPLLEGLQDARLLASMGRVREMFSLREAGDRLDRYAALMVMMPQRLDEMLTLGSAGGPRLKLRVPETASQRRRDNSSSIVTALLLLLAAAALLLPQVAASFLSKEWAGRVNAVVFVLIGAMILRAAARG